MPQSTTQVPAELMQQLHQATDRFHAAREELERWMEASEYRHQERITAAGEQLREAEREVEEIERRISELLHKS
jgi:chromosome segregation ATPase